jgi:hypothetical protein
VKQKNALLPSKPLRKTEPCFRSCSQSRHRLNPAHSICARCRRARTHTHTRKFLTGVAPPATCTSSLCCCPIKARKAGHTGECADLELLFRRFASVLAHSHLRNSHYLLPYLLSCTALQLPRTSSGVRSTRNGGSPCRRSARGMQLHSSRCIL